MTRRFYLVIFPFLFVCVCVCVCEMTFVARWKTSMVSFLRLRNHDCCYFSRPAGAIYIQLKTRDEKDFKPLMDTLRHFHGAGGLCGCHIAVSVPGISNKMHFFSCFFFFLSFFLVSIILLKVLYVHASCCNLFDLSVWRALPNTIHRGSDPLVCETLVDDDFHSSSNQASVNGLLRLC